MLRKQAVHSTSARPVFLCAIKPGQYWPCARCRTGAWQPLA